MLAGAINEMFTNNCNFLLSPAATKESDNHWSRLALIISPYLSSPSHLIWPCQKRDFQLIARLIPKYFILNSHAFEHLSYADIMNMKSRFNDHVYLAIWTIIKIFKYYKDRRSFLCADMCHIFSCFPSESYDLIQLKTRWILFIPRRPD